MNMADRIDDPMLFSWPDFLESTVLRGRPRIDVDPAHQDDRGARLLCFLGTDSNDGWKLTSTGAGCLTVSLIEFLKDVMPIDPGQYPLEIHRHEGSEVVGFRLP